MLRHRNITVVFLVVLTALILLDLRSTIHWSLYLLPVLLFLAVEIYGAYFIHSGFHLKAVCNVETSDKVVALSFDDGPAKQTEKVLSVLDESGVKATFFCIGKNIRGKEEILKKIDTGGHLVGNHSYSHGLLFDLKNTACLVKDLELCKQEISAVIHKTPLFFRPPYGVTTPALARAVKRLRYDVIGWNIRSLDTSIGDKTQVLLRIKERLQPGSIILMHDSVAGIDLVVKDLLIYLKEQNYRVIGLDQLIQKKAYV